jgi:uncharacterized protein
MTPTRKRIASRTFFAATVVAVIVIMGTRYHGFMGRFQPIRGNLPPVTAPENLSPFQQAVLSSLNHQVDANIRYQDGYYVGGAPPPNVGVCTDVVIRSYEAAGVDLHRRVATDVAAHPRLYAVGRPDPNIDHRRCRNLAVFFKRHALTLPTVRARAHWQPGDIVLWDSRGDGHPDHIGVIGNHLDASGIPTVIHHMPGFPVCEMDCLYQIPILYHFRWRSALRVPTPSRTAASPLSMNAG